jgi:hypothetical protein
MTKFIRTARPNPSWIVSHQHERLPDAEVEALHLDREPTPSASILEIYDAMAEAAPTGTPCRTRLDPPPADPRVAHAGREGPRGSARIAQSNVHSC